MKKSLCFLLAMLAFSSTAALAFESIVDNDLLLEKFSYQGAGFKNSKQDLTAKGFECSEHCEREQNGTRMKITFIGDRIQSIVADTRYQDRIDCEKNQSEIKKLLEDSYNFEYVSKDHTFLGINIIVSDVTGTIRTKDGEIAVDVSCKNDSKISASYVNYTFKLKDISYRSFKDDFKYE